MNPFEDNYNRCEYKEKCNIIIRSKDISTLNLYTKCPYCKGRGLRGGETNTVNCGSCNGTGKLNTDLGYQILYK
jgi:DnaJ-class molecular chaperone